MKRECLKQIKDAIRDLKENRQYLNSQIEKVTKNYQNELNENIENLAKDSTYDYFVNHYTNMFNERMNRAIYELCESYGNDSTFHIIYNDGTEYCGQGADIVTGESTPKMQHIAYAHYMDGYTEFDTESGELDYDVSDDSQFAEREEYFNNIERKYNTRWGMNHPA